MGQISCGAFPVEISAHILSLCVTRPLFLKKNKLSRHFKGKSIWDWDMNLGCKELGIQPSCVRSPCAMHNKPTFTDFAHKVFPFPFFKSHSSIMYIQSIAFKKQLLGILYRKLFQATVRKKILVIERSPEQFIRTVKGLKKDIGFLNGPGVMFRNFFIPRVEKPFKSQPTG